MNPNEISVDLIDGDKEYRDELRHRCQTDHLFLAPLLGYTKFVPRIHKAAAELYVQKNPELSIEDQDVIKNRMHIDPRHTFKTTMGIVDNVQWIINFPDITILNETATQPLAHALTDVTSSKFYCPKSKLPSIFQRLFPEHVVYSKPEAGVFDSPARTMQQVENTIMSTSVGTTQSGWHPYIICPDDMVDTKNSGIDATDTSRKKVINTHNTNVEALRHGGYINFRGTRYHPFELYGETIRTMNPARWKVLIRSAMRVRSGKRLVEGQFPPPEDVELLFPELLSYEDLREKFQRADGYVAFMCQMMNDPQGGAVVTFPKEMYKQAQSPGDTLPQMGEVCVCWRLPYEGKENMKKYAWGAAVRFLGGRVYVIDAWRGHFMPDELCTEIIDSCRRYSTGDLTIERTPGSEYVIPHIYNEGIRRNWTVRINQPEWQMNDAERQTRCRQLQPMMKAGRLRIATNCGQNLEIQNQFENFELIPQNGFLDVISRLALRIPVSVIDREIAAETMRMHENARGREAWDTVFSNGGATVVEQAIAQATQSRKKGNSYGFKTNPLGRLNG